MMALIKNAKMATPTKFMLSSSFFLLLFFACNGSDTISTNQFLSPNQTIVSKQDIFELGFFLPAGSTNYYVGIWYKDKPLQSVWVANRNDPISPSLYNTSLLQLTNGSLTLIVNSVKIWTLPSPSKATEAVLLDTGNFVLKNASAVVWQSFEHPAGTWLPGAAIGFLSSEIKLISWTNANDPATGAGSYSLEMESNGNGGGGELLLKKNGSQTVWKSGFWSNGGFPSFPNSNDLYNFSYVSRNGVNFFTYNVYSESVLVRIVLLASGGLYHYVWSEARRDWFPAAVQPSDPDFCTVYANCGANAICDVNYAPACRCLEGFAPRVEEDWDLFDFSKGCGRERALQCEKEKTVFSRVSSAMSRGGLGSRNVSDDGECEALCLDDCSCSAYANNSGDGCMLFKDDLMALQRLGNQSSGGDLFVRMERADLAARKGKRKVVVVASAVSIAVAVVVLSFFLCCLWPKLKSKVFRAVHQDLLLLDLNHAVERNSHYELPVFSFSSIATATTNFSDANKLGEGGFGPVYKGELLNGQFVAVKRLSWSSGQGLEEFRNETQLIAKLQHKNLVGILGCCTEKDENILVYEYMPNKSLDVFIFDSEKKGLLDWNKRVEIIKGIAQGLLYLHHYSRLRMIHRDLKASNVLLDAEMNPKISDFGMARIFRGNESRANTKRIVGTYGYMSPEYAMKGVFSLKSDVYSFGVVMLEIITGKTISGFYGSNRLSLLEYGWNMWKLERGLELVDPVLEISTASSTVALRCIKIGLLCVQENPADRPLMSDVVAMLSNDRATIASPEHPAFSVERSSTEGRVEICSVNDLTVSQVEAR